MLLIGREREKGRIGKIPGPSPSKSGKSRKNRESPQKDKKGQKNPDRETPPFETRLGALECWMGPLEKLSRARTAGHVRRCAAQNHDQFKRPSVTNTSVGRISLRPHLGQKRNLQEGYIGVGVQGVTGRDAIVHKRRRKSSQKGTQ